MKFLIQRTKVLFSGELPLESTASVLVTALVFLLPLFFLPGLALSLQFTKTVLVALIVFLGLIFYITSQLRKRQVDLSFNPVLLSLWLIPIVYFISSVFSGNTKLSMFGNSLNLDTLSFILLMVLAASLVVALVKSQERIIQTYLALFTSFGVLALFHLSRLVFGNSFLSLNVFTGSTSTPIGAWNDLAIFSGLIAILSLIVLTTKMVSGRTAHMFRGSLIASLFFLLLINFTTVWWVVGFFSLATFVYSVISVQNQGVRKTGTAAFVVVALSLVVLFFGSSFGSFLSEKFNTQHFDVRPSFESTIDIGKSVYSENALLGSGPNTFDKGWLLNKPLGINNTVFWNVDFNTGVGFVPTSLVTTGLLGFIAWALFFFAFLFAGFKSLILRSDEDTFSYRIILASFLSSLYLWLMLIISAPSAAIIGLAFIFTGIFVASLRHQSKNVIISLEENPRLGFISVLVLTAVFLGSIAGLVGISQKYFAAISHQSGLRIAATDLPLAIEKITRASELDSNDQYFRSLTEAHIVELNQILNNSELPAEELQLMFQTAVGNAVKNGQKALEIDNTNYQNWLQLGRVYQIVASLDVQGAYENAVSTYSKALEYNPDDPSIYLRLAELEVESGSTEEAKNYIGKSLQKKNNYSAAVFLLTQIQIDEGNVKDAISSAEALTIIDPNNATAYFQLGLLRYNSNDDEGAITALTKAVNINASYSNARYFLGLAYYNTDRIEDSIKQFKEVQKRNPENNDVAVIIDNLESGRGPIGGEVDDLPIEDE